MSETQEYEISRLKRQKAGLREEIKTLRGVIKILKKEIVELKHSQHEKFRECTHTVLLAEVMRRIESKEAK